MDVNQASLLYSFLFPSLMIVLIYFLVCHAGTSICELFFFPRSVSPGLRRWQWVFFWFWFITLLLCSAYGIFSSLLLYIEGPVVMRESLDDAGARIIRLENVANTVLAHPEWDKYVAEVRAVKQRLHNAILPNVADPASSHFCGFGSQAKQNVTDLQTLFRTSPPTAVSPCLSDPASASGTGYGCIFIFEVTRGDDVDHDCAHKEYFQSLQRKYDDLTEQLLTNHPDRAKLQVVEKDVLRDAIVSRTSADGGSISSMLSKLQGVVSFFPDLTLYHLSSRVYADASQHYSESYNRLLGFAKAEALGLPPALAAPAVDEIATPWRVPDVVVARATHATTWIYLGIAVAVDLIASLLAANVVYVLTMRHKLLLYALSMRKVAESDVSYIWRPEPRPR
jgi:hypothetical protein